MKKTILLIVVGMLMGSTLTFAAGTLFFDVPAGSWYEGAVIRLADKGIITGYEDGSFRGEKGVNRAEVATMIDRAVEYSESIRNASFNFHDAYEAVWDADVCTKAGTVKSTGSYDSGSKTWSFDIDSPTHPSCAPLCILNESTKAIDVLWRC